LGSNLRGRENEVELACHGVEANLSRACCCSSREGKWLFSEGGKNEKVRAGLRVLGTL